MVGIEGAGPQEILARAGTLHPSRFRATYGDSPNLDYFLAGEVVTAAAGESWDEFVEERIFRPLGMNATSTVLSGATANPNMATGHVGSAGRFEVTPYRNVENVAAAAGMITNVSDLSRWLRLHLGRGSIEGRQILSREVLAESYRPQNILTPAYQALFNLEGLLNAYGFGWVVSEYRGVTLIEHGGALPGFGAVIAMIPERDVGVALLSNASLNQSIGMLKQLKFELLDLFIPRLGSP
jgi:CubicO group peptidase (beta-lactamase class C family)